MRAVIAAEQTVTVQDRPDPVPGAGEVLVAVRAAGLNGADRVQIAGHYQAPAGAPRDILGLEFAGTVLATGPGAERFAAGDRVMAITGGGGQATRIVSHERLLMRVPDQLDWTAAGGFPEAFITAHDALFTQARLTLGEHVLVNGAAGGVGTAAVQLAVAAGARVSATVRRPELHAKVQALGAEIVPHDAVADAGPFDVIVELATAQHLPANIAALAPRGRITLIGFGSQPEVTINVAGLAARRGQITASMLRNRSLEDKALATRFVEQQVLPLVASGRIGVEVSRTFALEDAAAAHEAFTQGGIHGKLVLVTD